MNLTKEIVDRLLDANIHNRSFAHRRVEALARSMQKGEYLPNNGQTIVVNKSHTWLLDGQHRLMAIRLAGYPVFDIPVVEVPDAIAQEIFNTIDVCHGGRRVGNMLELNGIANANAVSATISCIAKYAWKKQNLGIEEYKRAFSILSSYLDKMHLTKTSITGSKPKAAIRAAVLNAMLVSSDADVIAERWISVLNNRLPISHPGLNFVQKCIFEKKSDIETFFKVTKAMLCPSVHRVFVSEQEKEGLMSKSVI